MPGGTRPAHVVALLDALRTALDGDTREVLVPHADGADGAAVVEVLRSRLRRHMPAGTAVVLQTSGSTTGNGHLVALTAASLAASARATEQRLAGPGQWLLAVPAHHVAGLQVLVRSVVAGTTPVVLDTSAGFDPHALAAVVAGMRPDLPGYLSLVPTQLVRVLEAGEAAVAPLRRLAAVLVGGAATSPRALAQARDSGVRVVTTYGMTETGGGCVYDGVPIPGVRLRVTGDGGRVEIAGPVLAAGYLDDPDADADAFRTEGGVRWLRTSDRAALVPAAGTAAGTGTAAATEMATGTGTVETTTHAATAATTTDAAQELSDDPTGPLRLRVLGRVDDLINTGGVKVSPAAVERVLVEHVAVAEAAVVPVPDAEWGELVTAVVVPAPGRDTPPLSELRARVAARLDGAHAPRALVVLTALPLRGPGKVDRRATALIAADALGAAEAPGAAEALGGSEGPGGPAAPGGAEAPSGAPASTAVVRVERHGDTARIS